MMFHEVKRPSEHIATKANVGYDPDKRAEVSKPDPNERIDFSKPLNYRRHDPNERIDFSKYVDHHNDRIDFDKLFGK